MKLELFFEKFTHFADAPDAVLKMRKLILQLAVQGRLKSQGDESGFPQVRLDSLGSWAQGCGFPVAEQGHSDRPILFSKVSDMNLPGNEREILKTNHTIDEAAAKRLRIKVHPPGTVIFPKIGGAIATNKRRVLVRPTAIDNNCSGIIPGKSCSTDWLFLVLSAIDFAEYQSGTSVPAVNQGALGEIEVSLPPLAEQKRIVANVDELMTLCDRLEAQQQERETRHAALALASLARFADAPTPANLNFLFHPSFAIPPADLRKSIYQAAFDGALTAHSREADSPGEIPTGWVQRDIASLCIIEDGDRGSAYPDKTDFSESGHCVFLNTKNVRRHGFDFTKTEWISEQKHQQLRKGTLIRGDIVFTSRGTIGNVAHYDDSVPFNVMRINSGMFILRGFQKHMEASFLSRLLRSPQIRSQIDRLQSGSAQPQLPIREFRKFTSVIPPLAEQRQIVAKVEQLMALVDALETQLTDSRDKGQKLLEAVVSELTLTS